ncbi:MAG: carbamoyl phosphate synthase small subunit [Clostridia bacterium]|nr:carbamoyl phosphate synthase small subunit [Clostridia bacterium]
MEGLLYLEDGTVFKGSGFGYPATKAGELIFNTSMTGYQEMMTDPSFAGQIINMTYPLIGNYGISATADESDKIQAFGLVAKDISLRPSNYKSIMTLDEWMKKGKTPGVCDVDTRKITKKLRNEGIMKCVISNEGISVAEAKEILKNAGTPDEMMKTAGISAKKIIGKGDLKVAVLDFGCKKSVIAHLAGKGCELHLFPYASTAEEILAINPDGVFLPNGPGNPEKAVEALEQLKKLVGIVPVFGIGLGHELIALAMGGQTYKLPYGHRGANHGVYDKNLDKSYVVTQSHSFTVKSESVIIKGMEITHMNLNDGSVEGMVHRSHPVFSVQFYPKTSGEDSAYLYDKFIAMMKGGEK